MKPRRILAMVLVVAIAVAVWQGTKLAASAARAFGVGAVAPGFTAWTIDATPTRRGLADYQGSVVLLNLWATWCVPCITEMPSIQRLHERYAAAGLRAVAVSVDEPGDVDRIPEFVRRLGLTFDILHDPTHDIERSYRSRGIPSTFLIGRDGRLRLIRQGAADWDAPEHRAVVERLLESDAAAARD
ncbi:MAG: peroxiredoxin family protein [Gemmatimonadota bacterium]